MEHLAALYTRLSKEQAYLDAAKTEGERSLHQVWVEGIKEQIADEEKRLGVNYPESLNMTDEKTERDPHGTTPHAPGAKLDAGKPRCGLVVLGFPRALLEVSRVGTFGANKYTDHGWKTVPNGIERYTDALLRHLFDEATGEVHDKQSELHHAAHAAWNALARLELMLRPDDPA